MKLEVHPLHDNWVEGTYQGSRFQAKIYTDPSVFGIQEGRVSKLTVSGACEASDHFLVNYDRGWDVGEEKKEYWEPLVEVLEAFAQTDKFKSSIEARP